VCVYVLRNFEDRKLFWHIWMWVSIIGA